MSAYPPSSSPPVPNDAMSDHWTHIKKLLQRPGVMTSPAFEPSPELLPFIQDTCNVLVIGAGGLGCELLKDLALVGFRKLSVIDMDTIDVSNLNRQFLFRTSDVGRPKAEAAAAFVSRRIPECRVTPHYAKIQDYDRDFYQQFHVVISGLDSIVARRWINGMLISLLTYDDEGNLNQESVVPLLDGGTEGFKGSARVIIPGMTACVDCTLDLYPPQVNFPLCTIAHTPRMPEHCVEYVRILLWPKENPFGKDIGIDGDDPEHITWILDKSLERAKQYNIHGVDRRLTQGVVKRIIPAVASTNASIAAVMSIEALKLASSVYMSLDNYMTFSATEGLYGYTFQAERHPDCPACSQKPRVLRVTKGSLLQSIVETLCNEHNSYQMKSPGLTTMVDGKSKTLYIQSVPQLEKATKCNLKKSLDELGIRNGQDLWVADVTTPQTLTFTLQFVEPMEN